MALGSHSRDFFVAPGDLAGATALERPGKSVLDASDSPDRAIGQTTAVQKDISIGQTPANELYTGRGIGVPFGKSHKLYR